MELKIDKHQQIIFRDHEYEPISPIPTQQTTPLVVKVTDPENFDPKKIQAKPSKVTYIDNNPNHIFISLHGSSEEEEQERATGDEKHNLSGVRIPMTEELVINQDVGAEADGEDNQDEPEFEDEELSAQEIQNRMEERFFAPTPTTTESRTDCEFNTSQIDSSGLEDLPLKRESRKAADMSGKGFQQKIRSQAGRLRTKIRSIQKPKINFPDKSKFHLPERPKFNFPERPKFKLPERPKINLPERPKFNFPERPKFKMPERPKISMPNFREIREKTRTTSSLRRPLRDRSQYSSSQSTAGSKKNIFDTLNFRTYPRFFNKKKRAAEQNIRVKGKRALTPPPRMETDSIPSTPASRKVPFGQKWAQRYKDIKFADDENQSNQSAEKRSSSLKAMSSFDDDEPIEDDSAAFRDPDLRAAVSLEQEIKKRNQARSSNSLMDSDREQRSSGSSSERHRAGVLEEIDADEFFLRQKGLSREDVDVSRFLSMEIRDAFRSPKNALAHLDSELYNDEEIDEEICEANSRAPHHHIAYTMENNDVEQQKYQKAVPEPEIEPIRPSRSRSLRSKRSSHSKSSTDIKEEVNASYNTYPPTRPSRSRKESMQSSIADKQSIHNINEEIQDNGFECNKADSYEEDEPNINVRIPSIPSLNRVDVGKVQSTNDLWQQKEENLQQQQPPLPPKRRKSTKDLSHDDNDSIINEVCDEEKWLDEVNLQAMVPGEVTALQMEPIVTTITPLQHGLYDSPPVAPIRKARSRGTSLADEDRTSRGAESIISETQSYPDEDISIEHQQQPDRLHTIDVKEDNFGYAIVEKPDHKTVEKPERQKKNKPARPPAPNRKKRATTHMMNLKNQGINFFFTYPRRAIKSLHKHQPIRPIRNYSTIGPAQTLPSRPPRRSKVFREPVYADGDNIPFMDESEKETLDSSTPKIEQTQEIVPKLDESDIIRIDETIENQENIEEIKDLQSADVIEKMKERPLPAPPRPSRKSKGDILQTDDDKNIELDDVNMDNTEAIVIERLNIQISPVKEILGLKEIETEVVFKPINDELVKEHDKKEKEGTLTALKEIISQKKKEFFEPKKETITTVKTEKVTTKVESKLDEGPLFQIIPLKASGEETEAKVEETTTSTQTDPLPEGYIVEDEHQQQVHEVPVKPVRIKTPTPEPIILKTETAEQLTKIIPNEQKIPVVREIQTVIEKKVVVMPDPDTEVSFLKAQKLQVSELDVDKLNVNELQAKKISVSDIDGVAMQVSELSSKSGNIVVSGVELPPDFLRNLVASATIMPSTSASTQEVSKETKEKESVETVPSPVVSEPVSAVTVTESSQTTLQTAQSPPVVVYPSQTPIVVYPPQVNASGQSTIAVHPAIIPQIYSSEYFPSTSIPRTRSPPRSTTTDDSQQDGDQKESGTNKTSLVPVPKRRHHHSQKHHSSSTDEETKSTLTKAEHSIRVRQEIPQQSAGELIRQLLCIWHTSLSSGVFSIIDSLNRVFPEGEKRKDAQTAACILLVLIAGLIIVGFGSSEKTVHHHHWDFFPPPR